VLKIANGALRYKPQIAPEEIHALYSRYGIGADESASGTALAEAHPVDRSAAIASDADGPHFGAAPSTDGQGSSADIVVWKLHADNSVEPVQIAAGITDHTYTAVIRTVRGDLKEGDQVITGALASSGQSNTATSVRTPAKK
jgi:hypothetical protein